MLKQTLKAFAKRTGYTIISNKYYDRLFDIHQYSEFDCLHLLEDVYQGKKDLVFFDIGANIGQTSIKFVSRFIKPQIYSFEPVKDTFALLTQNLKAYPSVRTYQLAMGETPGKMEIYHRKDTQLNSLVPALNEFEKNNQSTSEIIEITTVDEFVKTNNIAKIHVLKSDTEGFEKEVIEGAKGMLNHKLIDMLYIEVGFSTEDLQHNYWLEIVNIIKAYKYHFAGLFEVNYNNKIGICYANALFIRDTDIKTYK
jgi:FkbM family methyltransferase